MALIANYFSKIKKNRLEADELYNKIGEYISFVDGIFSSKEEFINVAFSDDVKKKCAEMMRQIEDFGKNSILNNSKLKSSRKRLADLNYDITVRLTKHNDEVAEILSKKAYELIGDVEGRQLDKQQMKCIVKPSANHLVIAGAGTGKTTTIVGKVKYLLKSGACEAKDILVVSFTNVSASEMRNRINKETRMEIEASTFHKLGLNIIKSVEGITPKITQISLQKFTREHLLENIKNSEYLKLLCKYLLHNHKYNKSEFDFQSKTEYDEYLRTNPPVTLKGDRVKSYGEMDIANFLFENGIDYIYENEYEIDTRTEDRAQYYPDFYLPESGCYIEYFGINEKGEVPSFFTSRNGKSPSKEYQEGIDWKRKLHKTNKTTLIECYSYERTSGKLLTGLEEQLKKHGVVFNSISTEEIWDKVSDNNTSNVLNGICELIVTIISLMKSNEYDIEKLRSISQSISNGNKNTALVGIVEPIYDAYLAALIANEEIDFNDMINKATHMVMDGKYVNPYKYVIVDEYQDISKARFNLLKALRESADYKLFCMGDDWQSIYRFTGSDLDYILNFSKYWGATEISKIETTYRFTESLIDISGRFVMQNPAQIKKNIKGIPSKYGFAMGEIKGYTEELAIKFMLNRLRELPNNSSVFFLGRYTFDSKLLSDCTELECKYDMQTQTAHVVLSDRRDLKMEFLTAHKSKGLQADYVFIINNKDRGMGFPSKIQDDPLVDCLLERKEAYQFAEERRLFYVALTRAKIKSYLVVVNGNESCFANEMEERYANEMKKEAFTCPICGGRLEMKKGPYGEFYGCSNYKITGCTFKRKVYKKN